MRYGDEHRKLEGLIGELKLVSDKLQSEDIDRVTAKIRMEVLLGKIVDQAQRAKDSLND